MTKNTLTALIGSIQKFSTEDGPGIRTTVFLKGCPLNCAWCHNPELIDFEQQIIEMPNSCIKCGYCLTHCPDNAVVYADENNRIRVDRNKCTLCLKCTEFCYANALQAVAKQMTAEEVMREVLQDKDFYDNTDGGMTISGGEVMSQPEFAEELIDLAEKNGINVCIDTSGFCDGNTLKSFALKDNVSNILFDMKSIDDNIHKEYTGQSNKLILENLRLLASDDRIRDKIQMRMPLMSGINDSNEIISKTAEFYRENRITNLTLLPYHTLGITKMRNIGKDPVSFETPSDERVERIKRYFEDTADMTVNILGKV